MALMAEFKEFKEQAPWGFGKGSQGANRSQTKNINEKKFKEQGKHSRTLKLNKNLLCMSAPQCGQKHNALHLQAAVNSS